MSIAEAAAGAFAGAVAGFSGAYILFGIMPVNILTGVISGAAAVFVFKGYLKNKRDKIILFQFRDMLDSLNNSFSAGRNTMDAFKDAYSDLNQAYGEKSPVVGELLIIMEGVNNGFNIEELLCDMAYRMSLDDISMFAETFSVCNRLGGSLKKLVTESREIISDKIDIEMEIKTSIASNKNEINIMCAMPFVIVSMMKLLGEDMGHGRDALSITVKIIAVILFIIAFVIGRKIADIKV